MRAIGAELATLGPGRCTVQVAFSERVGQQQGFFHGALIGAMTAPALLSTALAPAVHAALAEHGGHGLALSLVLCCALLALALGPALRRSMSAMLEAANLSSDGLSGALRQNGLLAIHYAVSRVFDKDDSADLSKTMAALDNRLKMAERWSQLFERYTVSRRANVTEPVPE